MCSQTALRCELEVPSTPPDTGERCQHRHLVVFNLCQDLPKTPQAEAAAFKGTFGNVCLLKYSFITKNVRQESSFHTCGYSGCGSDGLWSPCSRPSRAEDKSLQE